jgi:hypothetical protein
MLEANALLINNVLQRTQETFNLYDTNDMLTVLVLEGQKKETLTDLLNKNKNALRLALVAANSRLRTRLSLMPFQYRDFAANMQAVNNQVYLSQRRDPKGSIPRT